MRADRLGRTHHGAEVMRILQLIAYHDKRRLPLGLRHIKQVVERYITLARRHCGDALCLKSCIAGAISKRDGVVCIDRDKCVGCYTCVLVCPYGALRPSGDGPMEKCQLCLDSAAGEPACVRGCPNRAIVFEEKEGA